MGILSPMIQEEVQIKPLTVSRLWQGRRFKTKAYHAYEKEFLLLLPRRKKMTGNVAVTVELYIKHDKTSDVDNFLKGILDIIVKKGYIEDDRKIRELHVHKYHSKRERVNIAISKP